MAVTITFCLHTECKRAKRYSSGYCTLHHRQIQTHGEIVNNKISMVCSTEGCSYWSEKKGLCEPCYDKSKRASRLPYQAKWRKDKWENDPLFKEKAKLQMKSNNLKKYGLTLGDHAVLVNQQQGKCKICKKDALLAVDHCHTTGKVRGLLCYSCNRGIGLLGDNVTIIANALSYLKGEEI